MTLEDAAADLSCLQEEQGVEFVLHRYGLSVEDIEHLTWMSADDPIKTTVLLHGVLLGLALGEIRERSAA
jgi:hypothetical protein